ncbi:MAG: DUF4097 family beta strand repeat protein [Xanthomonadales bacterium]|nr:DUF4097 family beta strand repeat protein [Xanthomonadales bacterium]
MRTSMTYPMRFWAFLLVCLLIFQYSSEAVADWCKYEKDIELSLDMSSSDILSIAAAAGELEIIGVKGTDEAIIHGKVCASKEAWLEDARIETTTGKQAQINAILPEHDSGWSIMGGNYLTLDLRIEVPENLSLEVRDSSGDLSLENVADVNLQDSSGDIEIENARGELVIRDSSGDIDIDQLDGNLTVIADSSGDIYIENVRGQVLVKRDSSGDIRVAHVSENVIVEHDSSGDISARDVGGDFRVYKDGSGGIRSSNIKGQTELPHKG